MDREDAEDEDVFKIDQLEAMRLLEEAWKGVKQSTIINCWQHTGILPSNNEDTASSQDRPAEPKVEAEVQEAAAALQWLNLSLNNQEGSRCLLLKPHLVDDIEELLVEPDAPQWVEDNAAELELVNMLHENDEVEDECPSPNMQEPSLKESLNAIKTLYNLTLFRANEPEFSGLFHTLSNIQSLLKAEQHSVLKDAKITAYFQNAENKTDKPVGMNNDDEDVILVD